MHDAEGVGFAVVALQPGAVVVHVVDAGFCEPTGQGDAVAVAAQGEGAHHRHRLIAVAARRHPGRHARGHQGRIEGAIQQAVGDTAPAGFPYQLHLVEAVLGEQALGLSHRQRRTGRQGHEAQVEIHLLQAMAGQHLVGLGLPLLHPLLAVEEIDDLRAQAVVARVVHHAHPLARPRDVHLQDAADLRTGAVGEHHDPVGEEHGLIHVVGHHHGGELVLIADLHQLLLQVSPAEGIEGPKRLIEQQQLRLDRQGAGDGHPLAHAAGEFAGQLVAGMAEPHHLDVLIHQGLALLAGEAGDHFIDG